MRRSLVLLASPVAIGLAAVLAGACGTTSSNTGTDGGNDSTPGACLENPDMSVNGVAAALSSFSFRNAFDPADTATYDPNDASSLPGPAMVDVWGDRSAGAHGTLGVFPPGFSAPPHVHTGDYHGVVLRGELTNPFGTDLDRFLDADPNNNHGDLRLTPGAYWYVPAGSHHTTTCVGPEVCWFYFHAESGFDFAPLVDATGQLAAGTTLEAPHADAVSLTSAARSFAGEPGSFVQFAPAWGDMSAAAHGTFGRFNDGAQSPVHVHSAEYYGVVISGEVSNPFNLENQPTAMTTAGFWQVPADAVHVTACASGSECEFYFHSRAGFDFTPLCE